MLLHLHSDQIVYKYIDDPCLYIRVKVKWEDGGKGTFRMTAGFRCEIDGKCALLGYYGATTGSGVFCLFSAYTTIIFVNVRSQLSEKVY
jgi:hypothetical protein